MNYFFPNSKTAVIQVPSNKYLGSITEVDRLVDEIGQYGNIEEYSIQKKGTKTNIIFKLAIPHNKFKNK